MKGRINEKGILEIERAGKFKAQSCCYDGESLYCSDECPQFGDPLKRYSCNTTLCICQNKELVFDEFEDLRKVNAGQ